MLLINKLTKAGEIKRIELRPNMVTVVLLDGTERTYTVVSAWSEEVTN